MRKKWIALLLVAACVWLALWLSGAMAQEAAQGVVRLHIIANSDDAVDQAAKLKVRDAVLLQINQQMAHLQNPDQAEQWLRQHSVEIAAVAKAALEKLGLDYSASASVGISDFPQRDYAGKVYPAGEYTALRLVLGQGEGRNWWCVAFPPLCLNDFTQADMDKLETLAEDNTVPVQFRSAVWEWLLRIMKGEEQR